MILHFEVLWGRHGQGRACRASALFASILAAPVAAQMQKSPFIPVSVESCLLADSLLGPLPEQGALVRAYYVAKMDSTRLVAGPERGSPIYAGESRPMISVSTSYSGHKPTTYPHADVSFLLIRADASRAASSGGIAEVVLTIDGSPAQLDSVPIKPTPSPVGQQVFISLQVSPNLFVALANAKQAEFVIAKERAAFSPHELRDIRGLYRAALCGVSTN